MSWSIRTLLPPRWPAAPALFQPVVGPATGWLPAPFVPRGLIDQINSQDAALRAESDDALRRRGLALRYRALSGETLDRLLPAAFALMREACRRALALRHYDTQLAGGIAMHGGAIAEMQTGEGKTLTAALTLYLAALEQRGAHLATANDYLAARDAALVRPAFARLGLTVGVIDAASSRAQRRAGYACDVTYAAAREFGFDFLRDRLAQGGAADQRGELLGRMLGQVDGERGERVLRPLQFMLVDEADSILIDDARTPLIVSALPDDSAATAEVLYRWAARVTDAFADSDDYHYDHQRKAVALQGAGRRKVRELLKPPELAAVPMFDLYEAVERAVRVAREFQRDRHYIVRGDEIVIVDENTGRLAEGRKWRDGLHQAIEAREQLPISVKAGEAARVTVQDFFRRYQRLAGMTGTAATSRRELRRIYQLRVRVIPTHRPCLRQRWPDLIFGCQAAKWQAILAEVVRLHSQGRPVLIGTRTIDRSELLSNLLTQAGVVHDVLNAHRHAEEARIVAAAGDAGKVTIATNMAGRGTDIQLGAGVADRGGLHVVLTELHESPRIDRQLIGRCSRQGDPGSFRQFLSLDDQIIETAWGPKVAQHYRSLGEKLGDAPSPGSGRVLRRAQAAVERLHYRQRRLLLFHEQERRQLQQQMGQDPYLDAAQ